MLVSPSVLAIADGVSGWESSGELANSGIWSRSIVETFSRLMTEYKISHTPHHLKRRDIQEILMIRFAYFPFDGFTKIERFINFSFGNVER